MDKKDIKKLEDVELNEVTGGVNDSSLCDGDRVVIQNEIEQSVFQIDDNALL